MPFCAVRCGYCDFNTYTLTELGVDGRQRRRPSPTRPSPSSTSPRRCSARRAGRSTRCSSAAARPRCWPRPTSCGAGRHPGPVRAGAGRRGDHRGQPRLGDARVARRCSPTAGFTRVSLGMQSAVPHVLRDPRAHPRPGQRRGAPSPPPGPPGSQVSVDLIYGTPGESLARLADQPGRRRSPSSPTTSRPTRWSSRRAPSWRPRCGAARCPRPRTTTRPPSTRSPTSVLAAAGYGWYEVSNWARREDAPVPPQRGLLGRRQLVGRRARARTATSAACAGGTSSTPRRMPRAWLPGRRPAPGARC